MSITLDPAGIEPTTGQHCVYSKRGSMNVNCMLSYFLKDDFKGMETLYNRAQR